MRKFSTSGSSEKTIAILGDGRWPQTVKEEADKDQRNVCYVIRNSWKKRTERPTVGGVSIRSRNGAPSRKGYVVIGHMTQASKKMSTPPAPEHSIPPSSRGEISFVRQNVRSSGLNRRRNIPPPSRTTSTSAARSSSPSPSPLKAHHRHLKLDIPTQILRPAVSKVIPDDKRFLTFQMLGRESKMPGSNPSSTCNRNRQRLT